MGSELEAMPNYLTELSLGKKKEKLPYYAWCLTALGSLRWENKEFKASLAPNKKSQGKIRGLVTYALNPNSRETEAGDL